MVKIQTDIAHFEPPYRVIVMDMFDCHYYADVVSEMEVVKELKDLERAIAYADAMFIIKNIGWESLQQMNELDAGYDVRIFDARMLCVYAAHVRFKDAWFVQEPGVVES